MPSKDGATLWEGEELALRFMLEDGKLNLCLRMLDDYSRCALLGHDTEWVTKLGMGATLCSGNTAVPLYVHTRAALEACEKFEVGVCRTLHNVWGHPEAAQTSDVPLLLELLTRVLQSGIASSVAWYAGAEATSSPAGSAAAPAEGGATSLTTSVPIEDTLVAHALLFLGDFGQHLHAMRLQMDTFMQQLVRHNVFGAWVAVVMVNPHSIPDALLLESAQGVALLVASEDFEVRREDILAAPLPELRGGEGEEKLQTEGGGKTGGSGMTVGEGMVALGAGVLKTLASSSATKRSVRPLLDLAALCKRRAARAKK